MEGVGSGRGGEWGVGGGEWGVNWGVGGGGLARRGRGWSVWSISIFVA